MGIVSSLLVMAFISFVVYYGFKKDDKDAETKLKEKKAEEANRQILMNEYKKELGEFGEQLLLFLDYIYPPKRRVGEEHDEDEDEYYGVHFYVNYLDDEDYWEELKKKFYIAEIWIALENLTRFGFIRIIHFIRGQPVVLNYYERIDFKKELTDITECYIELTLKADHYIIMQNLRWKGE